MRRFFKKDGADRFARTVLPFLLAFGVGVLLLWYPQDWRFQEFIRAFRDALMVAGVIGTFIELWSASVLVDHASDQLSERVLGYGLPKAAQDVIHDLVHKTKRVYRNYRATYRIVKEPNSATVKVYATVSYKVVNNGAGVEKYTPELREEGVYNPQLIALEFEGKTYHPAPKSDSKTGVIYWKPDARVKIKPSGAADAVENLSGDELCVVRWDVVLEMPQNYSAVIAFGGVTIDPEIEVHQLPPGFEFHASQGEENVCSHAEGSMTWKYNRAFVGGQHLRVWWRPGVNQ